MFTTILMHNDMAKLTGAVLKKLILDHFPAIILERIHTVDIPGNQIWLLSVSFKKQGELLTNGRRQNAIFEQTYQ